MTTKSGEPPVLVTYGEIPSIGEIECYLCTNIISPLTHEWIIFVRLQDRGEKLNFHEECFEVLAWTMTNFIFHPNNRKEKKIN